MSREIADWIPVLLKEKSSLTITASPESDPAILTRSYGDQNETWLLLVNSERETRTATLTLPPGTGLIETKMGGKAVQKENTVTVTLSELEPCFLRVTGRE